VAPPPTHAGGDASDRHLAGLGDRLLATIFDTVILVVMFAVIGMWAAARWGGITANGFSINGQAGLVTFSLVAVAGFLYYWLLEALTGATLGKAMVGIQVRKTDGTRCDFGASLVRNLLRIVDGFAVYLVGFLVAIFSKLRQRLGDHLGGTMVVDRQVSRGARGAVVALWLVSIVGGISGALVLHRGAPASATIAVAPTPSSASSTSAADLATPSASSPVLTSGDFKLLNLVWTDGKGGSPRPAAPYKPGDDVYAQYDLLGFATDANKQIDVGLTVTALDPSGLAIDNGWTGRVHQVVESATTPINANFHIQLPSFAPAGTYQVVITMHDALKNSDAKFIPTFSVEVGAPILPASALEIRNYQYAASKDGPPITPPVYHAGQPLYKTYDVFGMQFRDNRTTFLTAYKLIGPDGQVLIDTPAYDTTDQTNAYHPATIFMHFSAHMDLPASAPKGTYTEQYVVTDKLANTTLKHTAQFEVK